ncbi:cyclin-dependent kinase 2-interacting protein isoform X2 [Hyla sarda]|uniref:cyclin-dependent kinase 2-interacting protein isoform X2 n=1 Tax=Hyla sarda TaxID=327740 RepID=UPI0024C242B4|nr:cyclin-dependent kinase 2-interacting protein isoform X2 [Hyla sarda]
MENKSAITPNKSALTGSVRKIKDNAADWHNLTLRWESCNDTAFSAASRIVNLKISTLSHEKILLDDAASAPENTAKDKEELERLCSELLDLLEKMQKIQLKMEKLTSTFKGVCDLEAYQCSHENSKPVLFHTWPTALFCRNHMVCVSQEGGGCFQRGILTEAEWMAG